MYKHREHRQQSKGKKNAKLRPNASEAISV